MSGAAMIKEWPPLFGDGGGGGGGSNLHINGAREGRRAEEGKDRS